MTARILNFSRQITRTVSFPYLHFPRDNTPLLVYLHGAGAKGTDASRLWDEPLPAMLRDGLEIPFQVICPQCPEHLPGWPVQDLVVFLNFLDTFPRQPGSRIAVTGVSMGGRGTWELAYSEAGSLGAIVPVCGPSLPTLAGRLGQFPIWAFHGKEDAVVPYQRTQEMIAALHLSGNASRNTVIEHSGHSIGKEVYETRELWPWLLQHCAERVEEG